MHGEPLIVMHNSHEDVMTCCPSPGLLTCAGSAACCRPGVTTCCVVKRPQVQNRSWVRNPSASPPIPCYPSLPIPVQQAAVSRHGSDAVLLAGRFWPRYSYWLWAGGAWRPVTVSVTRSCACVGHGPPTAPTAAS
jgi:hypothetical protein